ALIMPIVPCDIPALSRIWVGRVFGHYGLLRYTPGQIGRRTLHERGHSMSKDPSDTLRFSISTEDLRLAITRLEERDGATLYQSAWRVLTRELGKRRELKVPVDKISFARLNFEPLPDPVKILFTPQEQGQ